MMLSFSRIGDLFSSQPLVLPPQLVESGLVLIQDRLHLDHPLIALDLVLHLLDLRLVIPQGFLELTLVLPRPLYLGLGFLVLVSLRASHLNLLFFYSSAPLLFHLFPALHSPSFPSKGPKLLIPSLDLESQSQSHFTFHHPTAQSKSRISISQLLLASCHLSYSSHLVSSSSCLISSRLSSS